MADKGLKQVVDCELTGTGEVVLDRRTIKDVERMHASNGMRLVLRGLNRHNLAQMRIGAVVLNEIARGQKKDN